MAQVTQLVCDRCGKPIDKTKPASTRVRLTRFDRDYHSENVDLCVECGPQFKAWLDDPNGVPPGYKLQPRPCPHNVPCADPNGCSGEELVKA